MSRNKYKHFQDRINAETIADGLVNNQFVFSAENSIVLRNAFRDEWQVQASVVNLQEKDMAYIYVRDDEDDLLPIGSVWGAKGLKWIITEEIVIIKDVLWHKYVGLKCNVELDDAFGYFRGPEKNFINVALRENTILQSLQHPVLVMSAIQDLSQDPVKTYILNINDKIKLGDRAWLIQEKDDLSTPGVIYYSLRETTIDKDTQYVVDANINVKAATQDIESHILAAGSVVTLPTESGYFKVDGVFIKPINIAANAVMFKVPFGVTSLSIKTKSGGTIITTEYQVVNK